MRPGFVGTGTIASSIIRGLALSGWSEEIVVSPRGAKTAKELADDFPLVTIATSNQAVIDAADLVVLSIRPQVAEGLLPELHIPHDKPTISLIAAWSLARVSNALRGHPLVHRAVPLPFVAQRLGRTPVFPPDPSVLAFFDRLGQAIPITDEASIDLLLSASATMGGHYAIAATLADWLMSGGVPEESAQAYVLQLMVGLADSASRAGRTDFSTLAVEFSTPGGLNEQFREHLRTSGTTSGYKAGLDAIHRRINGR